MSKDKLSPENMAIYHDIVYAALLKDGYTETSAALFAANTQQWFDILPEGLRLEGLWSGIPSENFRGSAYKWLLKQGIGVMKKKATEATIKPTEANIVINGVTLTYAQSSTMRVALEAFSMELAANGLGDDGHGKKMTEGYMARIAEIREALYKEQR